MLINSFLSDQDAEDQEFTVPNIMAAIVYVTNWKDLGRRLGLKPSEIEKIGDSESIDEVKFKLISHWIKNDREASWKKLMKALDLEFTLANVLSFVVEVNNWKDLGVQVGLKPPQLSSFEGTEQPKRDMIDCWMKIDPEASWEKLQAALQSPAMCENRVSQGIAKRRGSSFDRRSLLEAQSSVTSG